MQAAKTNSLESFVERHRTDFDAHEPRPDLWAALETQLDAPAQAMLRVQAPTAASAASAAPMFIASTATPQLPSNTSKPGWLYRYGIAAGLAALVLAAGASEAWKTRHPAPALAANTSANRVAEPARDEALYVDGTQALPAAERSGISGDSQLTAAVRGMETYYVAQLSQRETELRELGDTSAVPGRPTAWQQQLISLDSSYRLLKRELLRHPQPEALLTAMNRNLQIRLDILDQQLHPAQDATSVANAFVLADSRQPQ